MDSNCEICNRRKANYYYTDKNKKKTAVCQTCNPLLNNKEGTFIVNHLDRLIIKDFGEYYESTFPIAVANSFGRLIIDFT